MKNLPLELFPPLARKAVIFFKAAKSAYAIENRTVGFEEVSFYLLSHAIELSIKAVAQKAGRPTPRTHNKEELADQFSQECGFTEKEIITIRKLKQLNDGPGGLRYDNTPIGNFLPSTFSDGGEIVMRLLEKFE
jgi:HEPN domain-containing protein